VKTRTLPRAAYHAVIVLISLLVLTVLFYQFENWRGARKWEQTKASLTARGIATELKDLAPPPLPPEENFITPLFFELFPEPKGDQEPGELMKLIKRKPEGRPVFGAENYPPVDLSKWSDSLGLGTACSQMEAATFILDHLKPAEPLMESLAGAMSHPGSFNIDYTHKPAYTISFSSLMPAMSFADIIQLHGFAAIVQRDAEIALRDLRLLIRITKTANDEPVLFTSLMANAMALRSCEFISQGLASGIWNDAQLNLIIRELQALEYAAGFRRSLNGEMAFNIDGLDHPNVMNEAAAMMFLEDEWSKRLLPVALGIFPRGWFDQAKVLTTDTFTSKLIEAVHLDAEHGPRISHLRRRDELLQDLPNAIWALPVRISLPIFSAVFDKFAYTHDLISMAMISCALERYRLAEGKYPAQLNEIVPRFLSRLPREILTGNSFTYRLEYEGYRLYSTGLNKTDDGATVVFKGDSATAIDYEQGDWVWPHVPAR
jgi:hypothetical protein